MKPELRRVYKMKRILELLLQAVKALDSGGKVKDLTAEAEKHLEAL